ncbi:MAG TPA: MarR family transcriptional regulator [Methylomirabilota bacterium]|nr:MarR family transcriptional regulator [Methylomirabilota bacterium]
MEDEVDRIVDRWRAVRPDLDTAPAHVLQRITRAYGLQSMSFNKVFGKYGLTWGEHLVLAALRRAGPPYRMSPTALFNAMMLSSGAMTNRLDRLEEMGVIRRLPDPNDRRGRLVELTPKGLRLVDEAVVAHFANEDRLLKGLTARERSDLAGLLKKLLLSEPFQELDPAAKAGARRAPSSPSRRSRTAR